MNKFISLFTIDRIKTTLEMKRKNTKKTITTKFDSVTIPAVFVPIPTMTEVAIFAIKKIIGIFTILIIHTICMWYWTCFEELFRLRKKSCVKIKLSLGRIGVFYPNIFLPNGIGTIWTKYRNNISSAHITFSFMKSPMWPKSSQMSHADGSGTLGISNLKFISKFFFQGRYHKIFMSIFAKRHIFLL